MQFEGLGVPNKYFAKQMVFVQTDTLLADADVVYTSALLADAMKPLNVLSKFENHFCNYHKAKSENTKQPQCPKEKEDAIVEALKYFKII